MVLRVGMKCWAVRRDVGWSILAAIEAVTGLRRGVTGDTRLRFWPMDGLLEAWAMVLKVSIVRWAATRVRTGRWVQCWECRN